MRSLEKKQYLAPELVEYGPVERLTEGGKALGGGDATGYYNTQKSEFEESN